MERYPKRRIPAKEADRMRYGEFVSGVKRSWQYFFLI